MVFYVFFAITVLGIVAVGFHYHLEERDTGKKKVPRQSLFILSLFCTCVLYLPWVIYSWDPGTGSIGKFLLSIPYMFVRLMQTVSLDADYETAIEIVDLAEKSGANVLFMKFYSGVLFWISASVPFFGIWAVLGLFGNSIQYWFETSRYSFKEEFYIFNGAGKKNTDLAVSIWETKGKAGRKCAYVFCNINEDLDEETIEEISKVGGIYTNDSPSSLMKIIKYFSSKHLKWMDKIKGKKSIRYFLLEEEDRNFDDAVNILKSAEKVDTERTKRVKIDILLHDNELDNILDAQPKYGIFVKILDAERLYAQELYARWPLFSGLENGGKLINLLIIGKGSVAEELLRNAIWMGTIDSAAIKIRYIGEDADQLEMKMRMTCPGLFDKDLAGGQELEPKFEKISQNGQLSLEQMDITSANYVIIANDDDEANIRVAMWFKTWFSRRTPIDSKQPFIAVRVKDAEKAEQARQLKIQESDKPYDFHIFGTDKDVFSARNLLHSKLVESLFHVQLSYNYNEKGRKPTESEIESTWDQLNESVYNYRSSEASALYIVNRLFDSGAIEERMRKDKSRGETEEITNEGKARYWYEALYSNEVDKGSERLNALIDAYDRLLNTGEIRENLSKAEHRRWNAYMVSNGWITMTLDEVKAWMEFNGDKNHKDYFRLRHSCIVPWDDLDKVSEAKGKETDYFKNADRKIVSGVTDFVIRKK